MLRLSYSNLAVLTTSLTLYFQHGGWTARELLHLFIHRIFRSMYSIVTVSSRIGERSTSCLCPLLHLQSQQVGFRTAHGLALVAFLLIEGVTAFV